MSITTIELRDVMTAWSRSMGAAGVGEETARDRWRSVNNLSTWLKSDPRWVTAAQLETYLARFQPPARRSCYYSLATWFQYLCRVGWLAGSPLDDLVVRGDFAAVVLSCPDPGARAAVAPRTRRMQRPPAA